MIRMDIAKKKNIPPSMYIISITNCIFLYYLNNKILKRTTKGLVKYFFTCYFNDILAGFIIIAFANLLLSYKRKSVTRLLYIEVICWIAGVFWEYYPRYANIQATFDLIDIVAYSVGGLVFWAVQKGMTYEGKE